MSLSNVMCHEVHLTRQLAKTGWLRALYRRLCRWQQLHHERQQLRSLNDATLKDIGLTRADIQREASRPFWDDSWPRH